MSKVSAYKCDYCGKFTDNIEEIYGISPQPDLFDKLESYPMININKTTIHCCVEHYSDHVLRHAAILVDRKKQGEEPYKEKIRELRFVLHHSVINRWKSKDKK